jgi:hypothetical protein
MVTEEGIHVPFVDEHMSPPVYCSAMPRAIV